MSALVGYESSSDEDEAPTAQLQSAQTILKEPQTALVSATNGNRKNVENESTTSKPGEGKDTIPKPGDGPMVGPARPEATDTELAEDASADILETMSERDAIRYLTQTTHPMTSMPYSPPGSPDPALNAKFKRFLDLKAKGVHFNDDLANKSTFRNPGLLATMMMRAGLEGDDQYQTSLSRNIWDPLGFPSAAYKEELLRSQQALRDQDQATKKSLSAAGKRTIEFTTGGTSGSSSRASTPGMPNKRNKP